PLPTPQPLSRLLCSGLLCCEGANNKTLPRSWQAFSEMILKSTEKRPKRLINTDQHDQFAALAGNRLAAAN
ncbi:hypothetical protein, partial [Cupriavidus sp. CuC1]|uniref:hypothetical protein n=1 Tax=Cupriavidus sp. CuC1 TaxID=3373131 RepID=UPI0037D2BC5D